MLLTLSILGRRVHVSDTYIEDDSRCGNVNLWPGHCPGLLYAPSQHSYESEEIFGGEGILAKRIFKSMTGFELGKFA
jgi:hypothetical protein